MAVSDTKIVTCFSVTSRWIVVAAALLIAVGLAQVARAADELPGKKRSPIERIEAGRSAHDPGPRSRVIMGDEANLVPGQKLVARFPLECRIRLLREGKVIAETSGDTLAYTVEIRGIYRVEAWLYIDGEPRPWIYSNPIYLR
jgi:hypothetical protein